MKEKKDFIIKVIGKINSSNMGGRDPLIGPNELDCRVAKKDTNRTTLLSCYYFRIKIQF